MSAQPFRPEHIAAVRKYDVQDGQQHLYGLETIYVDKETGIEPLNATNGTPSLTVNGSFD